MAESSMCLYIYLWVLRQLKSDFDMEVVMNRLFASSGSCLAPVKIIKGKVDGITFTSSEFTGTMDNQNFWNDLRNYAKSIGCFVELRY